MGIILPDARQLSDEVLEALRLRGLRACELGFSESDVAEMLGVARETVFAVVSATRRKDWMACPGSGPDVRRFGPNTDGRTGSPLQQLIDNNTLPSWVSRHRCGVGMRCVN